MVKGECFVFNKKILPNDFVGRGKMFSGDSVVPVILHGTYNANEPSSVSCTIAPDGRRKSLGSLHNAKNIEINAKSNKGEDIRVLGIEQISSIHADSRTTWKGLATLFIKGQLKSFNSSNSVIECSIYIPYTPLASSGVSYIRSYDGTITIEEGKKREGIKLETSLGQAVIIDNYEYVDDIVGIDKATIRIRRCQIRLTIKRKGKYSLEALLKSISDVFSETLWLLSFLSRKRIVWYRAEAVAFLKRNGVPDYLQAAAHYQSWLGFQDKQNEDDRWEELLVKNIELKNGLFEVLNNNFKRSKHKALILRVIPYLLMSQEQGYFESHIANTYSAFETMWQD